jgi:hypothetical protein
LWNSGAGSIFVVFAIGRALQGHVNDRSRTIFNAEWNFHVWINAASRAIEVFKIMSKNARRAVDAWSIVGIRFGVVKDVRKLIAKLIWYASTEGR